MKIKYLLYRILGNDIPLRHSPMQTFDNVKFILDHEPEFEGMEKRWVINRIVNQKARERLVALLGRRRQKFTVIPFDPYKFKAISKDDFKARLNCLIDLNQVRNHVLREGREVSDWILPFDGNCCFTRFGWDLVLQGIAKNSDNRYAVISLLRVCDKKKILEKITPTFLSNQTKETELMLASGVVLTEPQIMFRSDFDDWFDENMLYSRDSKVDLLWRLGVPGAWDNRLKYRKDDSSWESRKSKYFGKYSYEGYVFRLPSGNAACDRSIKNRGPARNLGITLLMKKVDYGPFWGTLIYLLSRFKRALFLLAHRR